MDFNQFFKDQEASVKIEFLLSILLKNEGLRNQFIEYCTPDNQDDESPEKKNYPVNLIIGFCRNLKDELECLDFENFDWQDYTPRHNGYIEDYEAMEYHADDQINEIFTFWSEQILIQINNAHLIVAISSILGAYDACFKAEIPGLDDIFGDTTRRLLQDHGEMMEKAIAVIHATVISSDQAFRAMEIIFDHYQHMYEGDKGYLKYFEPLLISLAETRETADLAIQKLESSGIDESLLLQLVVKLYAFHPDQTEWVKKASQYFLEDMHVAKKLLAYNFEHDVVAFLRDAKILFTREPNDYAQFLHERLYPDLDLGFFKQVLWHRALRERNIELYDALRGYLDDAEKQLFINGVAKDIVFNVKVLEKEKRFDEILKLAQKHADSTWNFTELVTPILNIYPHEAFELISDRTTRTIEAERGRDAYQRICIYLKMAVQIKGRKTETHRLIHELYNRRPALPALKDEIRKAGLIS